MDCPKPMANTPSCPGLPGALSLKIKRAFNRCDDAPLPPEAGATTRIGAGPLRPVPTSLQRDLNTRKKPSRGLGFGASACYIASRKEPEAQAHKLPI